MFERPENSEINHSDAEDTDVIDGEVSNFPPIDDVDVRSGDDVAVVEPDVLAEVMGYVPDSVMPVVETRELVISTPPPGLWQRIRRLFVSSPSDVAARLDQLTHAIEDSPEAAANYVLRGEVYMEVREYALAYADFQRAVEVAEAQFEIADWGLLEQAMRDRALSGLAKVQRRLR